MRKINCNKQYNCLNYNEGKKFIRTAVIEFSSFDIAKKFFNSKEYQSAHNLLKDTVVRHHQIVEGH